MGVAYYYTNIAEKTFCYNLDRINRSVLLALKEMGFSICDQSMDEGEGTIKAETEELDIVIKLKKITHKCTKMKVKVREGIIIDKATAIEIICQTENAAKKLLYNKAGDCTFKVTMAPLSWPLTHEEIELIDGLPPKEAIRQGRVKDSPYVVDGKRYVPMSMKEAREYREEGIASWYKGGGRGKVSGYMTANGEVFNPDGLSAAHRYLPLPTYVRVTNLENHKSIIVRVNDRGPFRGGRVIDLSVGAARRLGFYRKGTARVLVETVRVEE